MAHAPFGRLAAPSYVYRRRRRGSSFELLLAVYGSGGSSSGSGQRHRALVEGTARRLSGALTGECGRRRCCPDRRGPPGIDRGRSEQVARPRVVARRLDRVAEELRPAARAPGRCADRRWRRRTESRRDGRRGRRSPRPCVPGGHHLDTHHRFENHRPGFPRRVLERHRAPRPGTPAPSSRHRGTRRRTDAILASRIG